MKHSYIIGMAMMVLATSASVKAQNVALKTNLVGWATASLNAGVEIGTAEKQTAQVFATLNPWTFSGEKRVRIWNIEPEYRWWTCQRFGGSFFGVHALAGEYNVKNVDLPFGTLAKTKRGRHYEGWYVGAGVTYGYQWLLSRHWNLEASLGIGYAYSPYNLYGRCAKCLEKSHRNYVGPTKVALSFAYIF